MIPQAFLEHVAADHAVSDLEMEVLTYALEGEPMATIAQRLELTPETVRKRLGEVYKKFHISGAGPGKLAKLQHLLMAQYQQSQQTQVPPGERELWDIQDAPTPPTFYGRTEELQQLTQWIVDDRCRVVGLWGAKGIGKTALTVKLAEQIQASNHDRPEFEVGIWRSWLYAPSLSEVFDDLIQTLDDQASPPDGIKEKLTWLLHHLSERRCLVILDGIDGIYRHEADQPMLESLLNRLATEPCQSCLVVTTLERNKLITSLETANPQVHSYGLKGLEEDAAREMLQQYGLKSDPKYRQQFLQQCQGNPLALKKLITVIHDLFGNSITDFITFHSSFVENSIATVTEIANDLTQQFKQLTNSSVELVILSCLASHSQGLALIELKSAVRQTQPDVGSSELLKAIDNLEGRSLLERKINLRTTAKTKPVDEVRFALPPAVAAYLKQHPQPPNAL